jgi:carbonic anhydrase
MPHTWDPTALPPEAALARLIAGNRRFRDPRAASGARPFSAGLARAPQRPFAIILGCSDSRTPVEILFDQGFGDLFVVRVAGHVVAPAIVGSIEFAASQFGSRLVVVMGHTQCGAVEATVRLLETGRGPESSNIRAISELIAPHLAGVIQPGDPTRTLREAVRANVRAAVRHLCHGSSILAGLVAAGRVAVVGAEYQLETGVVDFFANVPGAALTDGDRG